MRLIIHIFICKIILIVSAGMAQAINILPDEMNGWVKKETIQIETPDELYDYIDGGAELYLSYGFVRTISRRYVRDNEPDITAEVFEMAGPADAFGIYSQTRDRDEHEFGQGSYYVSGALFFWKGKYWVSISTTETTPETEACLKGIARYIDNLISETGQLPMILSLLPQEELVPGGVLYFHHYIWLNAYYFISTENILNIDSTVNAVMAKYRPSESRLYILLVQYPGASEAEKAFKKFSEALFPRGLNEVALKNKDEKWMAADKHDSFIIAVFNGSSREETTALLAKAKKSIL